MIRINNLKKKTTVVHGELKRKHIHVICANFLVENEGMST